MNIPTIITLEAVPVQQWSSVDQENKDPSALKHKQDLSLEKMTLQQLLLWDLFFIVLTRNNHLPHELWQLTTKQGKMWSYNARAHLSIILVKLVFDGP